VPNVVKIWEPKPPGTPRAIPGLLRETFTFNFTFMAFSFMGRCVTQLLYFVKKKWAENSDTLPAL
jgi:hypothetical protein